MDRIQLADGTWRAVVDCDCGYPEREGGECDHAIWMAEVGGAFEETEVFRVSERTSSWRLQYSWDIKFEVPSLQSLVGVDASGLRSKLELQDGDQVLPMLAVAQGRGRPKELGRQDRFSMVDKANPMRPTLGALGQLVYVPKNRCSLCGQPGHNARQCVAQGLVKGMVNECISAIYEERAKKQRATARQAAKAASPPATPTATGQPQEEPASMDAKCAGAGGEHEAEPDSEPQPQPQPEPVY